MKFRFVWIGRTRSGPVAELVSDYLGRAGRLARVSVDEIRDVVRTSKAVDWTIEKEGAEILEKVGNDPFVVVLDERGVQRSSTELAELLENHRLQGTKQVTFVIGGYGGLSDGVRRRADLILALSKMTLTHEMARLFLVEQVYRALTIINRIPYQK